MVYNSINQTTKRSCWGLQCRICEWMHVYMLQFKMRCLKCICIICHDSFLELVFKNGYWLALFSFQNTNRYPSSHLFCRQVSKYLERERPRPEAHPRLANITRKRTHLETTMPFTWRNLNRSCAFSRSLNFSLAVKVSYGTNRGWLPPPGLRKVRERTTY